jgi:hypothetical protein
MIKLTVVRGLGLGCLAIAAAVLAACSQTGATSNVVTSSSCTDDLPRQISLMLVNLNSPRGAPARLNIMGRQRLKLISVQPIARVQFSQGRPAGQQQDSGGLFSGIIAAQPEQHDLMPGEALTTNGTWVEVSAADATVRPTPHQLVFCLGVP